MIKLKKIAILGMTLAMVMGTVLTTEQTAQAADTPPNPIDKPGWILTKNDEFNGTSLDQSLWTPRYLGFRTSTDRGNADYYFKNGSIVLRVTEQMPTYYANGDGMKVSSLQTAQGDFHQASYIKNHNEPYVSKFSQKHGYFEIRAKGQSDRSGHAAFWTNTDDPSIFQQATRNTTQHLEIDVFENFKQNQYRFNLYNPANHGIGDTGGGTYPFDFSSEYHIYAMEWTPEYVKYFVDNKLVAQKSAANIVDKPMFFYLSLYVNTWGGDSAPTYPAEFEIDYFRAYKKAPSKVEAEQMTLTNYAVETNSLASGGKLIKVNENQTGTSTYTYNGEPGVYNIRTAYYDENDGSSAYTLSVNGVQKDSWTANQNLGNTGIGANNRAIRTTHDVTLKYGDKISINGSFNGWEYARLDYIEFEKFSSRVEAETMTLTNYKVQGNSLASNGGLITVNENQTGTATFRFTGRTGTYNIKTAYYDENDGSSAYTLSVNGIQKDTWTANQDLGNAGIGSTNQVVRSTPNVSLVYGDQVTINGSFHGWEYARLDYVEFE